MNTLSIALTVVLGVLLLALPRRFAAIPLLLAAAYITRDAVLHLGPANFTVLRILVAIGFVRVLARGERVANGMNAIDWLLILWAVLLIGTSAFHKPDAWVFRTGIIWSDLGCYFLFRIFIRDWEGVVRIFKVLCVILVPVAVLMILEKFTASNFFAIMGGDHAVLIRDEHVRARGPFAHSILAGTVGAACFPIGIYLWKTHRMHALLGLSAAAGIVFASTSSGPIMMALFSLIALVLWKARRNLRALQWLVLSAAIALHLVMKDPVYFLMARIDITGSSKGWYRARLIQSSIEHLNEWWLAGTDSTRHWMATGIYANETHADITNHLLAMGVMGGLPLMLIFILLLVASFRAVGRTVRTRADAPVEQRFLMWTLGAMLFSHMTNFFSIALFDQSIVFFYLVLAAIGAVQVTKRLPRAGSLPVRRPGAGRPLDATA